MRGKQFFDQIERGGCLPQHRRVMLVQSSSSSWLSTGETALSFFRVANHSDKAITGAATYNVHPPKMGLHFQKIQCFCFEEQRMLPGETVDMPVFYFIDPDMLKGPQVSCITDVTLSHTFFPTGEDDDHDTSDDKEDWSFSHLVGMTKTVAPRTRGMKILIRFSPPWNCQTQTGNPKLAWNSLVNAVLGVDPDVKTVTLADDCLHATVPAQSPPGLTGEAGLDDLEFVLRQEDNLALHRSASWTSTIVCPLAQPVGDRNANLNRLQKTRNNLGWAELGYSQQGSAKLQEGLGLSLQR